MPGYKAAKDRLTLLFGGNASRDIKLKPLLVYHSENPTALKNIAKRAKHSSLCLCGRITPKPGLHRPFSRTGFPPLYPRGREILLGEGHPIQHYFAA